MTLKRPQTKNNILCSQNYINADEAAAYLRISKQRFYNLTYLKRIPHFKFGKRILVKREDLDSLIIRVEPVKDYTAKSNSENSQNRFTSKLLDRRYSAHRGRRIK